MTPLLLRLAILIAVFATVFLLSQLVMSIILNRRAELGTVNRRMSMLRTGQDRDAVRTALLKNAPPTVAPDAPWWQRRHVGLIRMVMMSGISMSARNLLVGSGIASITLFVLMFLLVAGRFSLTIGVVQLIAIMSVIMGAGLPLMVISHRAQRRRKRMQDQFPNALDIFIRSLRAGHPIASAIDLITQEMQDPIGSEFGLVADEVSYGAELNDALFGMAERWDLEDIRMFVVCVAVQSETGGNLAEILENLARVIRDRANLFLKVRALSSEGRMTGWMLTVLPVFAFTVLFTYNPGFYLDVAQDPIFTIGFPMLIGLYAIGVFSIRRLTDLKV
ncbi:MULTISPECIES: type II secretion system F family protein [unclassified Sphingobium]|uniref:type II secretion system F family protein n=1 Tax=unclassified Sphingobium TaxID=2611147 RepID=UPI0007F3ED67|nr:MULTISPECIES: type II secretion system F family protein [unclassified Sphingobium]OAN56586.1 secretion system protein [Sphingobium sp. TCM1]WIW90616.1 type II secretion system F family protein [Sphingobium sp. V4]